MGWMVGFAGNLIRLDTTIKIIFYVVLVLNNEMTNCEYEKVFVYTLIRRKCAAFASCLTSLEILKLHDIYYKKSIKVISYTCLNLFYFCLFCRHVASRYYLSIMYLRHK